MSPISYKILYAFGGLKTVYYTAITLIAALTVIMQPESSMTNSFFYGFWNGLGLQDIRNFDWITFADIVGQFLVNFMFSIVLLIFTFSSSLKAIRVTLILSALWLVVENLGTPTNDLGIIFALNLTFFGFTFSESFKEYCFSKNKNSV